MVSPGKAMLVGSQAPLRIVGVQIGTSAEWQPDDAYVLELELNRATDDFEARVFEKEFVQYHRSLRLEYVSIRVYAEVHAVDPTLVIQFLDEFNARIAQRREEAAAAKKRLNAQGEKLLTALTAGLPDD